MLPHLAWVGGGRQEERRAACPAAGGQLAGMLRSPAGKASKLPSGHAPKLPRFPPSPDPALPLLLPPRRLRHPARRAGAASWRRQRRAERAGSRGGSRGRARRRCFDGKRGGWGRHGEGSVQRRAQPVRHRRQAGAPGACERGQLRCCSGVRLFTGVARTPPWFRVAVCASVMSLSLLLRCCCGRGWKGTALGKGGWGRRGKVCNVSAQTGARGAVLLGCHAWHHP